VRRRRPLASSKATDQSCVGIVNSGPLPRALGQRSCVGIVSSGRATVHRSAW